MHALKLSFVLRYQMDVPRSVVIPMEKLAGINLVSEGLVEAVMLEISDDDALMRELFGDYLNEYRDMSAHAHIYWKDLMRFQEKLEIVAVPA